MKDKYIDELFNGESHEDEALFGKDDAILFVPRKLREFKELQKADGKDIDLLKEYDILLDDITGAHAERLNEILGNMSENNFVSTMMKLMPFVKPRYKAIDAEKAIPASMTQINVTIVRSNNKDGVDI